MIHLRSAGSQDAEGIARVHAITWKEAYRGLLDESYLAAMSPDRLKGRWIRHLGRRRRNFDEEVFVAVQHDRIIGFLTMGASQDASLPWDSEIGMIYLLAERRGAGLGRALMAAAADHSVRRGMFSAGLWVLRDNAAGRAFYEALGGEPAGSKSEQVGGAQVPLISYWWRDVASLSTWASVRMSGGLF